MLEVHATAGTLCRTSIACSQHFSASDTSRLATGEMVIGPKRTLFMDEISTGLDASTTLQIVRCMRNLTVLRQVGMWLSIALKFNFVPHSPCGKVT